MCSLAIMSFQFHFLTILEKTLLNCRLLKKRHELCYTSSVYSLSATSHIIANMFMRVYPKIDKSAAEIDRLDTLLNLFRNK